MRSFLHLVWMALFRLRITNLMSDRLFTELLYLSHMGRKLDLRNPVDFNQKEQWLKLYYHNPLYVTCADKFLVREYVARKIGINYLNDCLGVYENVEDINVAALPRQFVLKATHGSGWNLICADKSRIDWRKARRTMQKWLKSNFYGVGREWQYREIHPRIICEAFLKDSDGAPLRDYKLFTFRGVTKYIAVEFSHEGRDWINFYDSDWKFQSGKYSCPQNNRNIEIQKPECFDEMKRIAHILASDFPMCRVDFYVIGGCRIVFGELTFTPGKGCNVFAPQSFCDELGGFIELPNVGADK